MSRITVERILSKLLSLEFKVDQIDANLSDLSDKLSKVEEHLKNEPNDKDLILVLSVNKLNYFVDV